MSSPLEGGSPPRLRDLQRMGLAVPPGFDVMPSAYRAFMKDRRLFEVAEGVLAAVDAPDPQALERAVGQVRHIMKNAAMPDQVAVRVRAAYESLGQGPVRIRIVRPGGPGVQLGHKEWPEPCNVQGIRQVLHAIKSCWAACFSPAGLPYGALGRCVDQTIAPVLSVQKVLSAEVSGVVYTQDSMHGRASCLRIEAVYGLSDPLLEGRVTPDVYLVERTTQRVVACTGALQPESLQASRSGRGGAWRLRYGPFQSDPRKRKLTDAQAQELARMALRVEGHLNGPQAVEWAIAEGQVYALHVWPAEMKAVSGREAA